MNLANHMPSTAAQGMYHDVNQLKQLTALSASDSAGESKQAIEEVAKQFESMLVHQMLKSMRDANKSFAENSLFNTERVEFYQQMLDDQWSIELTSGKGLGFADSIANQYSHLHGAEEAGQSSSNPSQADVGRADRVDTLRRLTQESSDVSLQSLLSRNKASSSSQSTSQAQASATKEQSAIEPAEFVERLMPLASKAASILGVPAEQIVAQAALETGWGKHMLTHEGGRSSHNYFGIKADSRWQGERVQSVTTEFIGGKPMQVNAAFRSYSSVEAAFNDYVEFLSSNTRYDSAIESRDNFAMGLQQAGYATDPAYAEKIQRIANQIVTAERAG